MPYQRSPTILSSSKTTNAVANTLNANLPVIGAPGAGLALRIVALHVAAVRTTTAPLNVLFHDASGSASNLMVAAVTAGGNDRFLIPEPGILLPTNTAFQCDDIANLASQGYYFTVKYFTDTI